MKRKLNIIDEEAINKALWLSDYCKLHDNKCSKCIFHDIKNASVFNGEECILKRNAPDQWKMTVYT